MRNPARKAAYSGSAVAVSAGLILWGIAGYEAGGPGWGTTGPMLLGFAILPFPLYTLVEALFAWRGKARLLGGGGGDVIARWQVDPGEWERFRGVDSRRTQEDLSLGNALWVRRSVPARPVEVIFGKRSVLVDGSYHSLSPRGLPELRGVGWIEGPPTCLEFSLYHPPGRYGPGVTATLRVPVPAGARSDARRVADHFAPLVRQRRSEADIGTRIRWILIVLAGGAAAAWALALAVFPPEEADAGVPVGLKLAGTIMAVFALILGLAGLLLGRRR